MQLLSLVWGFLAFIGFIVGFIPCLGWFNWLNIPFAAVGVVISVIALVRGKPENKSPAQTGLVLCTIAVGLGIARLTLGFGIF